MADQNPGDRPNDFGRDLGDRIQRDVHDHIQSRLDRKRLRWEAKMERRRLRMAYGRSNPFGGLVIGLILAGIGVLLLLQNLGVLYVDDLWEYWPVILILVGGSRLMSAWDLGGRIFGGIVMFVGGVFLLRNLGLLHGNVWAYFWPVMLIAIGLGLLIRALEGNHAWDLWSARPGTGVPPGSGVPPGPTPPGEERQQNWFSAVKSGDIRNTFKEDHIFSGAKRRIESQDFEGGEALAIFGGIELDLRKADTKHDQVFIEANAIFGGIEIRVPETWKVTVRGTGIFSGYNDETIQPLGGDTKHPNLIITGAAVFGGVNVKN
jgi:hypothetical protein